ncbi:pyridoxal phosphate-dependent aminotransferase [Dermabacteraceae bacterium TAE3-ERU27]|nr:pyridoxal phosphate-dependent aminotransferase [Dermabacteraceae bacterium TAE3-ERU27]
MNEQSGPARLSPSETVSTPSRVSRRIGAIAPSATLQVDAKAKRLRAEGKPVIGFGAGEPDFPTPARIVAAAQAAAADQANHRYSPAAGLPALREAIAQASNRYSHANVDASQVIVSNGGKQAVYQTFASLLDPGDEVLLAAPYWTTYPEAIRLAGGVPVPVFAGIEQDYTPTLEQFAAALTPRTKVLVIVSPSNPTGAVMDEQQLAELGRWALENNLFVVSDEIYQHLVYDGTEFTSILAAVPELADSCVLLNGVAKTFAMTGWRVGWAVGPSDVIAAQTTLQSHLTSNVCNVAQQAALEALTGGMDEVNEMRRVFDRRRLTMIEMLREIPGFQVPTPRGAFYAFPEVSALLGREVGGVRIESSQHLAEVILEQANVAVVPGEAFGAPGHLRLSYALCDEDLRDGVGRIQRLLGEVNVD